MKHRIISVLLALALLLGLLPRIAPAARAASSGTCWKDLTWELSDDGVLTISGTGSMTDYNQSYNNRAPWYRHRSLI